MNKNQDEWDGYGSVLFKDGTTQSVHISVLQEFIKEYESELEPLVLTEGHSNEECMFFGDMWGWTELTDGTRHRVQIKNLEEFVKKYRDRVVNKRQ